MLKGIIEKIGYDYDIDTVELELPEDHIDMVVRGDPKMAPSDVMQIVKSISTRAAPVNARMEPKPKPVLTRRRMKVCWSHWTAARALIPRTTIGARSPGRLSVCLAILL